MRRIGTRATVVALMAAASVTASSRAWAAPRGATEGLVQQGTELYLHGQYEEARGVLQQAYAADPKPDTLLKLGLAELQAGFPVDAITHLRAYVELPGLPAAKVQVVKQKWLPRAEAETALLRISAPAGAELAVDGSARAAGDVVVAAGAHTVTARLGDQTATRRVETHGGELVDVDFPPPPASSPVPATRARAVPISAPAQRPSEASGSGGAGVARNVTVLAVGALALTGIGLGLGYNLAVENDGRIGNGYREAFHGDPGACSATPPPAVCGPLKAVNDLGSQNETIRNVAYGAGAGLAALAVVTFLVWPQGPREPTSGRLVPGVGPGGASVAWSDSF